MIERTWWWPEAYTLRMLRSMWTSAIEKVLWRWWKTELGFVCVLRKREDIAGKIKTAQIQKWYVYETSSIKVHGEE
jgi:hypothetical protein